MSPPTSSRNDFAGIFHPSDFTEASEVAFGHALKMALATGAKLTLFHVTSDEGLPWEEFPGVRQMLERWKLLPPGSPRKAVNELGLRVEKIVCHGEDPVATTLDYLDNHPTNLIVLSTHSHQGRLHWLRPSVAEPIARESQQTTLFVPHEVDGFVSRQNGTVNLRTVLIPVALDPWPQSAVTAVTQLVEAMGVAKVEFQVLHVGETGDMPALELPQRPGWQWNRICRRGPLVDTLVDAAEDYRADLIVMTTDGHHDFLDGLRGNSTEQVLHRAKCPLLAIPVRKKP